MADTEGTQAGDDNDVYAECKKSGYSRKYFEEHSDLLVPRKAARQAFDEYKASYDGAPLPKVKELSAEYSAILTRKKQNYAEYQKLKSEMHDWQVALRIVQTIQDESPDTSRAADAQDRESERNRSEAVPVLCVADVAAFQFILKLIIPEVQCNHIDGRQIISRMSGCRGCSADFDGFPPPFPAEGCRFVRIDGVNFSCFAGAESVSKRCAASEKEQRDSGDAQSDV